MAQFRQFNRILSGLIALTAVLILIAQVCFMARKAYDGMARTPDPPLWLTEMTSQGLLWVGFLGAALAVRHRAHLGIEALAGLFSPRIKKMFTAFSWIIIALFSALLAVRGYEFMVKMWSAGAILINTGFLQGPFYLCIVISGAASFCFAVEHLVALYHVAEPNPPVTAPPPPPA